MAALVVFDFAGAKIRTAGNFEAPLFCASDVCAVLELDNVGKALERLDPDEKENITTSDVLGKNRPIVFVTESGLFSLILGSRKPNAKTFKKWVTSEVLPEIRKRGFYDAVAVQQRKQTELLLAEIFPHLPHKSKPIFRELIAALLRVRREEMSAGNPPWARTLASLIYGWAIRIEGQQSFRRARNPKPNGSKIDHSMFSEAASEELKRVVHSGVAFAAISPSWEAWKANMEMAFGTKAMQLHLLVPMLHAKTPESTSKDEAS